MASLRQSYPEEFRLLCALIDGHQAELVEYMTEAPELVDHLLGYGLIVARDGIYEVAFGAVGAAVERLRGPADGLATNEGRWSQVNLRRNVVEQSLRTVLFLWTKTIEQSVWSDALDVALSEQRKSALRSREPHLLLAREDSPLYLSDLLSLLRDERVLPHLLESRSRVLGALNDVNSLRSDAHANSFSDAEFSKVIAALELLEAEFLLP